jgi:hypothetical protein
MGGCFSFLDKGIDAFRASAGSDGGFFIFSF